MKVESVAIAIAFAQVAWPASIVMGHPFVDHDGQSNVADRLKEASWRLKTNIDPRRRLQGVRTSEEFREDICGPLGEDFVSGSPGATCECDTKRRALVCTSPKDCAEDKHCQSDICFTSQATVAFTESSDGDIDLASIETVGSWTGAAYQQERGILAADYCEAYYTFDNIEYQCQDCTLCGENNYGFTLDCSNIQDGAVDLVCIDSSSKDKMMNRFFDICPAQGPETPSTPGIAVTPVVFSSALRNLPTKVGTLLTAATILSFVASFV